MNGETTNGLPRRRTIFVPILISNCLIGKTKTGTMELYVNASFVWPPIFCLHILRMSLCNRVHGSCNGCRKHACHNGKPYAWQLFPNPARRSLNHLAAKSLRPGHFHQLGAHPRSCGTPLCFHLVEKHWWTPECCQRLWSGSVGVPDMQNWIFACTMGTMTGTLP